MTYIRFVVQEKNNYYATGVFTNARCAIEEGLLDSQEVETIEHIFEWFNNNLPHPGFGEKIANGEWTEDAVAWFKSNNKEMISRMWEICKILNNAGMSATMIRTELPGKILYEDEFQIVAEIPKYARNMKGKLKN